MGNKINGKMLDSVKYIAAILVICVHCQPISGLPEVNYFVKNILCRWAVPFFFISSAYFVRRGMSNDENYLPVYLKRLTQSYLWWSVIFIPIGLDWLHQNLTLSKELLPLALIFGLIHVGTYYHLWYIPALILSLFIATNFLKHFSYKLLLIIATFLYSFGSIETYYGLIPNGWLKELFDIVIQIFFTTRSGLLFGLIFVGIGFFIYDYQEKLLLRYRQIFFLTGLFFAMMALEGILLYSVDKLDMNFLFMLIPFSFCLFISLLFFPKQLLFDTGKIRLLSKYYYFVHPICIVIVEEAAKAFQMIWLNQGIISFCLIFLFTHLICLMVIYIKQQNLRKKYIGGAMFFGMLATLALAGTIYQFKPVEVLLKFELVPCLWLTTSILGYFILTKGVGTNDESTGVAAK
ncbi:acyltransferase family protein [Enterococcus sp. AZ103]|uniref:acyltransferase family protein n=1 Tax=Enterococcus sp. AZ103 TaxID=2774628 RepID=UPI003F231520